MTISGHKITWKDEYCGASIWVRTHGRSERVGQFCSLSAMLFYGVDTVPSVLMRSLAVPRSVAGPLGERFVRGRPARPRAHAARERGAGSPHWRPMRGRRRDPPAARCRATITTVSGGGCRAEMRDP